MELIYTAQASGFEPGKRYRNPQHFDRPDVSPQTVAMIEQMGMRVAKSFQHDINRNGPMMQSIRKKL